MKSTARKKEARIPVDISKPYLGSVPVSVAEDILRQDRLTHTRRGGHAAR